MTGRDVRDDVRMPVLLENSVIESVKNFRYLGSTIFSCGRLDLEVEK